MVTSGFHLWQFQAFYSGAEGLGVVLFWLGLWEIFFMPKPGFDLGTSESWFLHSSTAPWWLLVLTSDNLRYLTLVQRDQWWYCSDWTCERFSLCPHQAFTRDYWICSPALYNCTMVTSGFHLWQFDVFNSLAEGLVVVLFCLDLWEIFYLPKLGFDQGPLNLKFCTWPPHHGDVWWSPMTIEVFNSGVEGLVVVLFLLDLWEIVSLTTPEFQLGTSGSLVMHSTTAPWWLLVFTSDNCRY